MKNGNSILDTLDALPMAINSSSIYAFFAFCMLVALVFEYKQHRRELRERRTKGGRIQ